MTQIAGAGIDELRSVIDGEVIGPADEEYDDSRKLWNAEIDRRPAAIVRCRSAEDVRKAVGFATANGLRLAVRGGAHGASGTATVDDGIMIDLSLLNQVSVDPAAQRAKAGGGALLADLDAATQEYGLATPAGMVSHTGVGGLTLGGGMGWLSRLGGLSIDNLVSAEVVTADGRILRASEDENPELFWALRGGGGNFGVVTEFEFRLHEVGPIINYAMLFWGMEQAADVLRLARDVIPGLPRDVNVVIAGLTAPPAPFVPEEYHFRSGYALIVNGFGSADSHAELIDRLRTALPPLFELVTPMPYVALQQLLDEANAWGQFVYEKNIYLDELTDEVIAVLTEHFPRKQSPLSVNLFYRLDGAFCDVPDDATAFAGGRSPKYASFMIGVCPAAEVLAAERRWVRSFWEALLPYASRDGVGYVNALGEDAPADRVRAVYGPKYERLARIKAEYDPGNVFHGNANIEPAVTPGHQPTP